MKDLIPLGLILWASFVVQAQDAKTPDTLIPSESSVAEAEILNAKAFKLLPRHTFDAPNDSFKDEDNPLGVRGGGSYYSFSTGSHSYNKTPQISLEKSKDTLVFGFYGYNFGLVREIGRVSLSLISIEDVEVSLLSTYRPPHLTEEIHSEEQRLLSMLRETGIEYRGIRRISVGKTYVLRTITFDEADLLVAFQILRRLSDGSVEIAWRKLKDYPLPREWYYTDDELRKKLVLILAKEQFSGVSGDVKENEITFRGKIDKSIENRLRYELHSLRGVKITFIPVEK